MTAPWRRAKSRSSRNKPEEIVAQAWKDAKKGKDMSKCGFKARMQALGVKILPHSMVMDTWLRQQELD